MPLVGHLDSNQYQTLKEEACMLEHNYWDMILPSPRFHTVIPKQPLPGDTQK